MELQFYTYRTTKGRLLKLVKPMGRSAFSNLINPIISKERGIALVDAKQQQFLQSNEVVEFLNKIGEPLTDHRTLVVLKTHQMNKSRLKRIFSKMGDGDLTRIVNRVISKTRGIDLKESKFQRYLLPKEVIKILDEIGELWNTQDSELAVSNFNFK